MSHISVIMVFMYYHMSYKVMLMVKNLKLKSARAAKDMTQKDLADAVGVVRQTINAIELGEYNPSIRLCITICKTLGKTLNDLFWEENTQQ